MSTWSEKQASERRALDIKVAVTHVFSMRDLEAVGYVMGREEPTRGDLRRWILAVVRRAVADATHQMEKGNPEEPDIKF